MSRRSISLIFLVLFTIFLSGGLLPLAAASPKPPPENLLRKLQRQMAQQNITQTSRTIVYTYDNLHRLTDAEYSSGEEYNYTYDARGNRLTADTPSGVTNYSYDAANRLNNAGYVWDDNGNLLDDGEWSYGYDTANRLITATNGITSVEMVYNGDGDRVKQIVNGVETAYVNDPTGLTQILQETTNGQTTDYVPGLAQYDPVFGPQYQATDNIGSVRMLVGPDGQLTMQQDFDPFGVTINQYGQVQPNFGFAGEYLDPTGLVNLRARYYAPDVGRFISPDSLVPDPLRSQAWNPYGYVENNPLRFVDPSGHCGVLAAMGGGNVPYFEHALPCMGGGVGGRAIAATAAGFGLGGGAAIADRYMQFPVVSPDAYPMTGPMDLQPCSDPGLLPGGGSNLYFPPVVPFPSPEVLPPTLLPGGANEASKWPNIWMARRNAHLAGKQHPVTGIPFDQDGYPDFSGVSAADVQIEFTGSRRKDVKLANEAAGFGRTPEDYVWHHHQDGTTMQLVPEDIHKKTGHDGGFSGN